MQEKRAKKWNKFPLKGKVQGGKKNEKKKKSKNEGKKTHRQRVALRAESDFKSDVCGGAETNYSFCLA